VDGLKFAGSPYAYHSIGSAFCCSAEAYIKAGGMRVHKGGEDFYFLQALEKTGEVISINSTMVHPSARVSQRVPFGTGPKIREVLDGKDIELYDLRIFGLLKELLFKVSEADLEFLKVMHLNVSNTFSELISEFLIEYKFSDDWAKILKNTPDKPEAIIKAFHIWFDSFRTLKFIHYCESNYPRRPLLQEYCNMLGKSFENKTSLLDYLRANNSSQPCALQ
jgi:hypothetical protein